MVSGDNDRSSEKHIFVLDDVCKCTTKHAGNTRMIQLTKHTRTINKWEK